MEEDLYATLGILPDADSVVISAVYRVLASKYHPDRWKGDPAEANERMAALNRAYAILRDPQKRRNYDAQYAENKQSTYNANDTTDRDFINAINEISEKWKVVINVFPNLEAEVDHLKKYSSTLAFAYMVGLMEDKQFGNGRAVASDMIDRFLTKYFSSNGQLKLLATRLIEHGNRDGARELNKYITIIGSDAAARIENKICAKYGTKYSSKFQSVIKEFKWYMRFHDAEYICKELGYSLSLTRGFLGLGYKHIDVFKGKSKINQFRSVEDFRHWLLKSVIPKEAP